MKRNIETLLKARGHHRKDLAQWCRRSESWISKIMGEDNREVPMKYFDRIADFFGIAVYQLFQPGINALTERRKVPERRKGIDRRIGKGGLTRESPTSNLTALVTLIGYLDAGEQADFVRMISDRLRGRRLPLAVDTLPAGVASGRETRRSTGGSKAKTTTTARDGETQGASDG